MIKSRSTLAIPPSRPRRIWLNAVGSQNGAAREEELRRSLPFCDPETGTKNRVVQRDPITGLGMLGREFDPLQECRVRSRSAKERGDRNPILGQGDLGTESNGFRRQFSVRGRQEYRNPIDLTGESNEPDLDALRPNNRPAKTIVQQVCRDPISGRGDFGREWDPIRKYAGRPKPLQQQPKDERNPITGDGIPKSSVTELWHRPPDYPFRDYLDKPLTRANSVMVRTRRGRNPLTGDGTDPAGATPAGSSRTIRKTNPLTGENCNSFSVKPEERPQRTRTASNSSRGSNPLTGEGYQSSDSRPSTPRKPAPSGGSAGGNPLTGENRPSYDLRADSRSRPSSAKSDKKNPLTGENCESFDLSAESRQRSTAAATASVTQDRPNPLTGENVVNTFDINQELRSGRSTSAAAAPSVEADSGLSTTDVTASGVELSTEPPVGMGMGEKPDDSAQEEY